MTFNVISPQEEWLQMHGDDGLRRDVYTLRMECEMRWGKLSVIVLVFRTVSGIFKNYLSRWYLA